MSEPKVTVVVAPRERFQTSELALETLYKHTVLPFKLVYIDGNSPRHIKRSLKEQAKQKGFHLIRTEHFLSPNQARNLGLAQVDTEYVVFIDNDLLVSPGWLESLVKCADETGAWVVGPLYLEGKPEDQIIHMAGGKATITQHQGKRKLHERHIFQRKLLSEVRPQLERGPTELIEFHCAFVRTEVFEKLGPLDEKLMSTPEHIDLCLAVREAGGTVYFEPSSIVTYLTPPPFARTDLPYYLLRWSDNWNRASLEHFRNKWNLTEEDPFITGQYRWLRRHRQLAFQSLQNSLCGILPKEHVFRIVKLIDKAINSYLNRSSGLSAEKNKATSPAIPFL
jgi:GT2 family glycosyltransferase